jgi:hypothetical protein
VTFGPDGLTSHHDHIRAGEAASEAFHCARNEVPGLQRLYHAALRRSDVVRFYAKMRRLRESFGEEGALFNPIGVADDSVGVRVDTRAVRDRKLTGILAHRTQIGEWERIPEALRWIHLDAECFVQAWPPVRDGLPVRADLFDGLDVGNPAEMRDEGPSVGPRVPCAELRGRSARDQIEAGIAKHRGQPVEQSGIRPHHADARITLGDAAQHRRAGRLGDDASTGDVPWREGSLVVGGQGSLCVDRCDDPPSVRS